jgi:hypothetical protein
MSIQTITNPSAAKWFVARNADGSVLHTGRTDVDQVTATGQPTLQALDTENAFLKALNPFAAKFPALPAAGTELQAGDKYAWNNQVVIVRQSHTRTTDAPNTVPALFGFYQAGAGVLGWIVGENVLVGDVRSYNGIDYECIQSHWTQADWTPDVTPALWEVHQEGGGTVWTDTGVTIMGRSGTLYYLSDAAEVAAMVPGEKIRLGDQDTTFVSVWAGTNNLIQINPYVVAAVGDHLWRLE